MGERTAFFYGTLMAREVLYRVCYGTSKAAEYPLTAAHAAHLKISDAILHDYSRRRVRFADYPGMVPMEGHTVRGTYVTGLRDADIGQLDLFEGPQYRRDKVKVVLLKTKGEGDEREEDGERVAETYVWIDGEDGLENREWDFLEFRREKMHNWADHSHEYDDLEPASDVEEAEDAVDTTGGRGIKNEKMNQLLQSSEGKDNEEKNIEKALESAV